jgi:SAM-dependent methyltransferase
MTADTVELRRAVRFLLEPAQARSVLDLGCGKGEDLLELARLVPAQCRLVGLDASDQAIDAARVAASGTARIQFQTHDLSVPIPFSDNHFDRVLSVNLLEAVVDKQAFLEDVHRVLTPSGRIVIAHWDWDSQLFDGSDKASVRTAVHAFADWKQAWMDDADGWMGRRLWKTIERTGLFHGSVHGLVHTSTRYEPGCFGWDRAQDFRSLVKRDLLHVDVCDRVMSELVALASTNEYFYSITMYVYVGVPRVKSQP